MKWEQMPDLQEGMDVLDGPRSNPGIDPPVYEKYLADDFRCTQTGPITQIDVWSSYLHDDGPMAPPLFNLAIFKDIPAEDSPTGYSMPGEVLWDAYLRADVEERYANAHEEFFDPNINQIIGNDTQVWQYTFHINQDEAFHADR